MDQSELPIDSQHQTKKEWIAFYLNLSKRLTKNSWNYFFRCSDYNFCGRAYKSTCDWKWWSVARWVG